MSADAQPRRFEEEGAAARFAAILDAVKASPATILIGAERWEALVEAHRAGIEAATTHEEFAQRVNALFGATGQSHFAYDTDEEFAYWHLLSAFYRTPDTLVEHIGLFPERIDGRWFIRGILEGSSAESLDLREGDELVSVGDRPFSPIRAFEGLAGQRVPLVVRRTPESQHTVTVTPVKESLAEAVGRAMKASVAYLPHREGVFAYAHLWMMLGDGGEYQALLGMQDRVDGVILDLRDGVGGTPAHGRQFLLGQKDPARSDQPLRTWVKPVVILIADGTRSAKELLVHDARKQGRAVLVGTPTPGHVTAVGGMPRVGADAVLILPGFRFDLEGKPTPPDVHVERDLRYAAGRDPQLDRAVEVLAELVREAKKQQAAAPSN
ncbi:MAG: hypothetical protein FLDDKLPJ_02384 [Phycisphaerae bacterium]|nr:hypothetical protein [Phycisphaerae bacterium]